MDWARIKDFDVQVIRSKREKTALLVVESGQLQLVVPEVFSDEKIKNIFVEKYNIILKKVSSQKDLVPSKPKEYVNGENFVFLGKNYRLKIILAKEQSVSLHDGYIHINLFRNVKNTTECTKNLLRNWYISQAELKLSDKITRFSKIVGVSPKSILIKDYKSRWGGCNKDGHIGFNWRIIIAPHSIIDYVVMHELCHILHHNHSNDFWYTLECHMPDYLERKEWLRVNGHKLNI